MSAEFLFGTNKLRSTELPAGVVSYETSADNPRFVGVPRDDQLAEDESQEGVLGGRLISEVCAQDSEALEREGISWERAVYVLQCLSVACQVQDEELDQAYQVLRDNFGSSVSTFASHDERERSFESQAADIAEKHSRLAGFGNQFQFFATDAKPHIKHPITGSPIQGDGDFFTKVAEDFPDRQLICTDSADSFETIMNRTTLLLVEAYHLLEKGNPYELTGSQLVALVNSFDENQFLETYGEWMQRAKDRVACNTGLVRGHSEKIRFSDNKEVSLSVAEDSIYLEISRDPYFAVTVSVIRKELKGILIRQSDYAKTIEIVQKADGYYLRPLRTSFYVEPVDQLLESDVPLMRVVQVVNAILAEATKVNGRLLLTLNTQIHDLAEIITSLD